MIQPAKKLAAWPDIAQQDEALEILNGEIQRKATPSFEHGEAQGNVFATLRDPFGRSPSGTAGWWLATEVDIELTAHQIVRPDVVGWRRERVPEKPRGRPVAERPDWVCEILSESGRARDLVTKLRIYHRAAVPHYWIVDPLEGTLTVHRWTAEAYVTALVAEGTERVRAEPFEAVELSLTLLFGRPESTEA